MHQWHPEMLLALGKLRAEELKREAEEWRLALLAAPEPRHRGGLAEALAWWRARLPRRRAESAAMAEQEQP